MDRSKGHNRGGGELKFLKELFKKKPIGGVCLVIMLMFLFLAIFADLISPYPMEHGSLIKDLTMRMKPPLTPGHLLGTDTLGQDLLSYMIYGARTSVVLCVGCTVLGTLISLIIGVLSATIGGRFDLLLQRVVDAWSCIPQMLILLLLMAMLGNGIPQMIFAMAVPSGIGGSRMVRSAAIAVKDSGYCTNSDLMGGGLLWKCIKHVVPNILPLIIISAAGSLGGVVLMEASLNFLGFGVSPGTPSWGYLITNQGRSHLFDASWLCIVPGIAITILTFSSSMFGDAVRDQLDPRLKGGVGSYNSKKLKKMLAKLGI
jgi:peptide/nickel transport system permease protein